MYEYIKGKITELTPAYAVIESGSTGYYLNISLQTYSFLEENKETKLFVHQVIREDAHLLFGFHDKEERGIFRLLTSVSGIGANTARVILSSLNTGQVVNTIASADVNALNKIKGIGAKTAQRIIVDLRDKISAVKGDGEIFDEQGNTLREESLSALVTLGFAKKQVEKVLDKVLKNNKELALEEVIKIALKEL